jgi:hypothetical protein
MRTIPAKAVMKNSYLCQWLQWMEAKGTNPYVSMG